MRLVLEMPICPGENPDERDGGHEQRHVACRRHEDRRGLYERQGVLGQQQRDQADRCRGAKERHRQAIPRDQLVGHVEGGQAVRCASQVHWLPQRLPARLLSELVHGRQSDEVNDTLGIPSPFAIRRIPRAGSV